MKKIWIFLIAFLFWKINFIFAFNFTYESIIDINKKYILIELQSPQKNERYLCEIQTLSCEEKSFDFSLKPKNFFNYFFSPDFKSSLGQIKIENNKFITLYSKNDNSVFEILNFPKKIERVFFGNDKTKLILKSENKFYLFSINQNKIIKELKLEGRFNVIEASPTLKYLAIYKNNTLHNNQRKFLIYDIENEIMKEFLLDELDYWDLLTENNKIFHFLSDEILIFLSDHQNYQTLYSYNIQTNEIQRFFPEDFTIKDFTIFQNKIFFTANKENPLKWNLYEYDLVKKEIKKLVDYVSYDTYLTIIDNFLIFKKAGKYPPRIYFLDLLNYELKALKIKKNDEAIDIGEPRNYENKWFVVLKPENFEENKEYDLIIWLHGGPYRQTSLGYHPYFSYGVYDSLLEKLRKSGFIVIKIDYPGSFGYGRKFTESLKENIGKIDSQSVFEIVKKIEEEFKIKQKFLMGNSYGGYLALKTIYEYPDSFRGAISINGVTDWWSLIKKNPNSIFRIHFDGPPNNQNLKIYNQASLFLEKERLKNKNILLIYGEKDKTIPNEQNFIFIKAYKDIAKIFYQNLNEGHIIKNKDSLEKILLMILIFTKL
ncbi:MAG: alpha/beta fold hydrolase [Candidatus Aenigmatarchaeota archaeon]